MNEKRRRGIIQLSFAAVSAYFREWTLAKKLWVGFGLLILLLAVSAFISYWQIQLNKRELLRVVVVQQPLEEVSLQMQVSAADTVEGIMGYLKDRDPADRTKASESAARFEQLTSELDRLAEMDQVRKLGEEVSRVHTDLKRSGNEVMSLADERYEVLQSFRQNVKEIDDSIDKKMKTMIDRTTPVARSRLEALLNMEINNDETSAAAEAYVGEPNPALRQQVLSSQSDFKRFVSIYGETHLSASEKEWLGRVDKYFAGALESADRILGLTDNIHDMMQQFESTVQRVDSYLNNEIHPLVHVQALNAVQDAKNAVEFAGTLLLILAAAGISIGVVSAWAVSRSIVRPVSRLVRGAEEIGRGMLDHRIILHTKDELGELAAAFNEMTENLEKYQASLTTKTEELEQEIAERERVEEALRRLAMIVESSDDAIVAETPDGIILSWNKGAERLFGYPEQEVQGKHISMLVPPNRMDEVTGILEKIKRGESVEHFETVHRTNSGALIDVSLTISPLKDIDGKIIGASMIARDITRRKRSELALRESEQRYRLLSENLEETVKKKVQELQLVETLASIGEMVSVVAHEIRNPLQNIQMGVDALHKEVGADKDKKGILEEIDYGVVILNEIVGELLEYSRPLKLQYSSQPVGELVSHTLKTLSHKLHTIRTRVELDEQNRKISVDSVKFSEVLINLISNAAEAMPNGGDLRIRSEFLADGNAGILKLSISDTGCGISEEHLRRIGKPFFTTKARGTGLGIPICKKIIEAHRGKLSIRSKVNEGTTVEIEVPVSAPDTEDGRSDET